jgi:hypothetical protein
MVCGVYDVLTSLSYGSVQGYVQDLLTSESIYAQYYEDAATELMRSKYVQLSAGSSDMFMW